MALPEVIIGRKPASRDEGFAFIGASQMRAWIAGRTSQAVWISHLGAVIGKDSSLGSNITVKYGLTGVADGVPGALLGITGGGVVSTVMVAAAGVDAGIYHEMPVNSGGPRNKGIPVAAGTDLAVVFNVTGGTANHGMIFAGSLPGSAVKIWYTKSGSSIPNPYGSATPAFEGQPTSWARGQVNEPPRAPVNRSPSGNIDDLTPDFEGDFRDRNGVWGTANDGYDAGDRLWKTDIQLTDTVSGSVIWSPSYLATTDEIANERSSRTYNGPALVRGRLYSWIMRHYDYLKAPGVWTSEPLTFTVIASGSITISAPSGVQQSITPTISARYTHQDGTAMASVRARIKQGNTVVYQSGFVTKSVASSAAPGTLFTLTYAEASIPSALWGNAYTVELEAKDTLGVNSGYSQPKAFSTDAPPTVPVIVAPSAAIITSLEQIRTTFSDADDTSATGLVGKLILEYWPAITNSGAAVDLTGWAADTPSAGITRAFTRATGAAVDGDNAAFSIAVSANTSGGSAYVTASQQIKSRPGMVEQVVVSSRTTNTALKPKIAIDWYNASNAVISTSDEADYTVAAVNTWQERTLTATAPALTAYFKIRFRAHGASAGNTGTVLFDSVRAYSRVTRSQTYDSVNKDWRYTPVADDLPDYGVLNIYAYAGDGTVWSGATTVEADASKSFKSVTYALGPQPVITSPTDGGTEDTSAPSIAWTVTGQVSRLVQMFNNATGAEEYSSGWAVTASTSFVPPTGRILDNEEVRLRVSVEDAFGIIGYDEVVFTLDYDEPDAIDGFSVLPDKLSGDAGNTIARASWLPSTDPDFAGYLLRRDGVLMARIESIDDTEWVDPAPISRVEHLYSIAQVVNRDGDVPISSPLVEQSNVVFVSGVVLNGVESFERDRVHLPAWTTRDHQQQGDETVYQPWDQEQPSTIRTTSEWWISTFEFVLYDDEFGAALDKLGAVLRMARIGGPLAYRDGSGRLAYKSIPRGSIKVSDDRQGRFKVSLQLRDEYYKASVE